MINATIASYSLGIEGWGYTTKTSLPRMSNLSLSNGQLYAWTLLPRSIRLFSCLILTSVWLFVGLAVCLSCGCLSMPSDIGYHRCWVSASFGCTLQPLISRLSLCRLGKPMIWVSHIGHWRLHWVQIR